MKLSRRVNAIKPSPTLALNAKAKALVAQGVDIASFAAGEPDFDTPEHIKNAAKAALDAGFTKYTATGGIPELKAAIAEKLKAENGLAYKPEQILVSVGAKHSLYNLFQALIEEGDEVVILAPYWVSYPDMVLLAGGKPVIVETRPEKNFAPTEEALRKALSPRTKAIIVNSPSNPTGVVLSHEELKAIAAAAKEHSCLIVSDDIYEKLLFDGRKFENLANVEPSLAARMVVVNGCSKAFSMTGWRIGYAAGPAELIAAMNKIQDQSTSNPTSIAQKAAVAALTQPQDFLKGWLAEYEKRRKRLVEGLNALPGVSCAMPGGAFYAFADFRKVLGLKYKGQPVGSSERLASILLDDFRVAAVPGAPFGAEGFLRLSYATSMQVIEKGLARLTDFAGALMP